MNMLHFLTFNEMIAQIKDLARLKITKEIHRCLAVESMVPCIYPLLKSKFLSTLVLDEQKRS